MTATRPAGAKAVLCRLVHQVALLHEVGDSLFSQFATPAAQAKMEGMVGSVGTCGGVPHMPTKHCSLLELSAKFMVWPVVLT